MTSRLRALARGGAAVLLAAGFALTASHDVARADVLVMFKNGKAMRVKSAARDGKWLRCEFEDKNFISVPAAGVLSVEEAVQGSTAGELHPNQVAVGSGGGFVPGPRGGGAPPPEPVVAEQPVASEDDPNVGMEEELAYQRQKAMEQNSAAARRGMTRGIPIPPGQNPAAIQQGFPAGLQPLNQATTPFQNRRLNSRRGIPGDNLQERLNQNPNQSE